MIRFRRPRPPGAALRPLRDDRAFTIAEVAIASLVLLFGITSAIVAMQIGYKSLDLARTLTLSSQVLQSEIELVRMKPWGEIKGFPEGDPVDLEPSLAPTGHEDKFRLPTEFTLHRVVNTIRQDPSTSEPLMREIIITATWKTIDGKIHRRSTSTQYCKEGLNDYYVTDPST